MASLYVLSCATITRCLSLCVLFLCVIGSVCLCECVCSWFNKKKKSHCVTTARLVLSCFGGEGKTGRIRGDMSIGSGSA